MKKPHGTTWIWAGIIAMIIGVGFAILSNKEMVVTEPLPISDELKSTLEPMPAPVPIIAE